MPVLAIISLFRCLYFATCLSRFSTSMSDFRMTLLMATQPTVHTDKDLFGVPHELVADLTISGDMDEVELEPMPIMEGDIRFSSLLSNTLNNANRSRRPSSFDLLLPELIQEASESVYAKGRWESYLKIKLRVKNY